MRRAFLWSVSTLLVLLFSSPSLPAGLMGIPPPEGYHDGLLKPPPPDYPSQTSEISRISASVQASGDIRLDFGVQHSIEFTSIDNLDLDNGLTDGCLRAATTGNDCSGTKPGIDGFVTQDTRLIVQGSQDDIWRARVVLESDEIWAGEQLGNMELERGWADVKIFDTPVHVKAGLMWDNLDPFRLVFGDREPGVKVYADHGNISWAVWWFKEDEVAAEGGATGGRDGDQDYYMARVKLDFGSFQVGPAIGFLRNRSTTTRADFATGLASIDNFGSNAHNFRTAQAAGTTSQNSNLCESFQSDGTTNFRCGVAVDENVIYPGIMATGAFGPVSFVGEVFGAFGEIGDDSAVDAQRNQDVSAYLVAADVGVKLGAWTPHAGFIYLSGDDNPHDDDAEAWHHIEASDASFRLLGNHGIVMEESLASLSIGSGCLIKNCNDPNERSYFTQPGIIAVFVGLKGRPTKKIRTDFWLTYLQWDMEKQWEYVDGMVTTVNCTPNQTQSQQGVCSNSTFTNGVADGSGLISTVDDEVGWELNGQVTYSYNKHVGLTMAAAVFWPGDGAEVVAQCANAAGQPFDLHATGCGNNTTGGSRIITVSGISRADDEAFKAVSELFVAF